MYQNLLLAPSVLRLQSTQGEKSKVREELRWYLFPSLDGWRPVKMTTGGYQDFSYFYQLLILQKQLGKKGSLTRSKCAVWPWWQLKDPVHMFQDMHMSRPLKFSLLSCCIWVIISATVLQNCRRFMLLLSAQSMNNWPWTIDSKKALQVVALIHLWIVFVMTSHSASNCSQQRLHGSSFQIFLAL